MIETDFYSLEIGDLLLYHCGETKIESIIVEIGYKTFKDFYHDDVNNIYKLDRISINQIDSPYPMLKKIYDF